MKALSRKTLAVALTLGAAVFAWPVQALRCPVPPYWPDAVAFKEIPKAASNYAKARVGEMQSIFIGRVVSAEYTPLQDRGGAYVITYEVSEWLKGSKRPHARIVWYPGIPCADKCRIEETIQALQAQKTSAVYFADPLSKNIQLASFKSEDLDGVDLPCAKPHSIPIAMEPLPSSSDREYHEVLFRNALRLEIQAFRKAKRRS